MYRFTLVLVACVLFFANSCKSDQKALLPKITGKAGEVVLVVDKFRWEGEAGSILSGELAKELMAMPQPESMLDVIQIPPAAFTNIFQTHRNIVMVKVNKEYQKPRITVQRDVYARHQLLINIIAPDDTSLQSLIKANASKVADRIVQAELDRNVLNYKNNMEKSVVDAISKNHGFSLVVPKGYSLDVEKDGFLWISHESADIIQGVLVYYHDYVSESDFTREALLNKRDEVLKENVPGPTAGSYMTTERQFETLFREYMKDDKYYAELRGLWRVQGDFMGGPFVSISMVDEKRNRVITAEGFVYAPRVDKRTYLRQVEAILSTLSVQSE